MTELTQSPTDTLSVDFGRALSALLRRYLDNARDAVSELPGGPRGFQVMSISATGACANQARIAESLGLDRTVMTYLVDDLERAGLAERRPDPVDRRAGRVLLTAKGRKAFDGAAERIAQVERMVLDRLSDDDAEHFRRLLMNVTGDVAAGTDADVSACEVPRA